MLLLSWLYLTACAMVSSAKGQLTASATTFEVGRQLGKKLVICMLVYAELAVSCPPNLTLTLTSLSSLRRI